MRARQRKLCRAVIERRRLPYRGIVTGRAVARESSGCMRRVCRRIEIRLVATNTGRCLGGPRRYSVTAGARRHRRMSPRQREFRRAVVEGGRLPHRRIVTGRTVA